VETFNIRDLRQRTGDLVRAAEGGRLSVVTKHGRPVFVALPMSDRLLASGVHQALAIHLFEAGVLSLSKAARLAEISAERFIDLLGASGIDAAAYEPGEVGDELRQLG